MVTYHRTLPTRFLPAMPKLSAGIVIVNHLISQYLLIVCCLLTFTSLLYRPATMPGEFRVKESCAPW